MAEVGPFDPRSFHTRAAEAFSIGQKKPATRTPEEQEKLNAWNIAEALRVASDFLPFVRPEQPERPPSFPADEDDLRYALKRARGARHATDDERTLLREHADWRMMCWRTEHEASARVQALYGALRSIDAVTTSTPDPTLANVRAEIVAFMAREWDLIDRFPVPTYFEARDIGDQAARAVPSAIDRLRSAIEPGKVPESPSSDREEW